MPEQNLMEQNITDALEQNYMPYAMSVIISRAIPEIDGFKPAHRKLLYTMYKMNLIRGARLKSSNVVGETMKLNPHGDQTIYDTLVRLTRGNGTLLHPFIDSKGNFGKVYSRDMAYAAPRYTEVKLEQFSEELFADIDKDTVDFVDNFDGRMKEPLLLPTAFPNLLVNPNQGIAVGMASNICSFNLKEVCDTTIAYLKDEQCDLSRTLKAPDFSTGGELVYNKKDMDAIYEAGRGSFKLRATYQYDQKNNCIEVLSIPYTATIEAIIDKSVELIKLGKLREISDIRDESDKQGLKLTFDLKRGTDPDALMVKLYKMTQLMDTFSCNFNILINGYPRVMGVREILYEWTKFRTDCVRRRLNFDLDKKSRQLHLLLGLQKILLDIDKAVKIIRETEAEAQVVPNLMAGFGIDDIQAEYIAEIKLRHLNKEYILKRLDDIEGLNRDIADIEYKLSSNLELKKIIIEELGQIAKKYGEPRRTAIISETEVKEFHEENLIEDYNVHLFMTRDNYFKKIPLTSLRASSDQKLKEGDVLICDCECSNRAEVLFFSDRANCYKARAHELSDCKASAMGDYLPNILEMEPGETILYMTATADFAGHMLFAYENGKMAKVPLAAYETKTNRKKLANAYSASVKLVSLRFLAEDTELVAFSSINKVLVFKTEKIAEKTTRTTQGVQVMNSKKGSTLARVCAMDDVVFKDFDYYRTKNIPATGTFLAESDSANEQLSLF